MDADGTGQTNLTNNPAGDFYPAWSPDDSRIAFESCRDGKCEIYVMNADGSHQTRLTTGGGDSPTWSPDGTRIAFISDREGEYEGDNDIYVMNTDGSNVIRLTNDPSGESGPSWSPDGSQIAFSTNLDLGNFDVYPARPTSPTTPPRTASPPGRRRGRSSP